MQETSTVCHKRALATMRDISGKNLICFKISSTDNSTQLHCSHDTLLTKCLDTTLQGHSLCLLICKYYEDWIYSKVQKIQSAVFDVRVTVHPKYEMIC